MDVNGELLLDLFLVMLFGFVVNVIMDFLLLVFFGLIFVRLVFKFVDLVGLS